MINNIVQEIIKKYMYISMVDLKILEDDILKYISVDDNDYKPLAC